MTDRDRRPQLTRNTMPRGRGEAHDLRQWAAYIEGRARRPSILRPWHSECLELRADDRRIHGAMVDPGSLAPEWRRGLRDDAVRTERVVVDAYLLTRVCRWPELPDDCTPRRAARRLGVSVYTIYDWVRSGRLVKTPLKNDPRRFTVQYPPTARAVQLAGGRWHHHPDRAKRVIMHEPDVRWVADRFRNARREETLIRQWWPHPFSNNPGYSRPRWLCPVCGRSSYVVYLPAGEMARQGRTWGEWRFQCRRCAGVQSESAPWHQKRGDGLNQYILKLTCGLIDGTHFRWLLRHEMFRRGRRWEELSLFGEPADTRPTPPPGAI
ncbi:MAG: helix-turn-helix domain-containing protein [Planctomycetes bacterium]|nr:helix-turn-helix domain-containing protein [Planctomycetota bacterium]